MAQSASLDDYIKVFKKDKEGLAGRFKILGQVGLGLIVGATLYFHDGITIKEKIDAPISIETEQVFGEEIKSTKTTIPFVKNNEFDYEFVLSWMGGNAASLTWIVFILMVIFVVTAVSNGANMTDGLDGLATGTSAIIGATLGILAYVSGNVFFADYLNIMYIPNSGELVIYMAAFVGACVGFLWYNSFPAQVFMGDTGSLALGGIIAVFAIAIRKELLIPVLCGIFLVENLSVMLQVGYFKYTKKKFGEREKNFQDGSPTSSFPKAWHARKQNCYSLLDCRSDVGHLNYCNTETTIDEKASCAWRRREWLWSSGFGTAKRI